MTDIISDNSDALEYLAELLAPFYDLQTYEPLDAIVDPYPVELSRYAFLKKHEKSAPDSLFAV